MKHFILWSFLLGSAVIGVALFEKTSVATMAFKNLDSCPIYINVILFLLGANLAITRFIALLKQVF